MSKGGGAQWQSITLLRGKPAGFSHPNRGITFVNRGFCDGGHIADWPVLAKQTWGASCNASVPGFIEFTAGIAKHCRLGERVSMRRVEYRDIAVAALTIVLVSTLLLAFVF